MNPYASLSDDFGVYCYLNTEMALPNGRETVLHYFETLKKTFPGMNNFFSREGGEFALEEDKESGSYRWAALETRRLCSGYVNPPTLEEADRQHLHMLKIAPYHFDINSLDCEALDVVFAFDFVYNGNHDEIVAEALGFNSAMESLLNIPQAKVIKFEPAVMLGLDDQLGLQCRLSVETRTNAYQVRTGQFHDEPISVYFTVRQYWRGQPSENFAESYGRQRATCQELVDQHIVPAIVQPLARAIAGK
jgi:hypothetical protein